MEHLTVAKGKYLKISPRKIRLVADMIRNKDAGEAITILKFSKKKKASGLVLKVLNSAVANAQVKSPNVDVDNLYVSEIFADKAPYQKRFRATARGRGVSILKRYAHLTVYLDERKGE